jgi:tetratricopeptide (TPR) repeat protein
MMINRPGLLVTLHGMTNPAKLDSKSWVKTDSRRSTRLTIPASIVGGLVLALLHCVTYAQGVTVRGHVLDEGRVPISGVLVLLEREGESAAAQTMTAPDGEFSFSQLKSGTYSLVAVRGEQRSAKVPFVASDSVPLAPVEIILSNSKSADLKPKQAASAQPMEFADSPSFTIAGVTDWTAAGGHGSDATLRTSEALNREMLSLKPNTPMGSAESRMAGEEEARLYAALASAPASPDLNRQMGELYLHQEQYAKSISFLQRAFALSPGDPATELDLARACEGIGDVAEARRHVEHLLSLSPNAKVHHLAGGIYEKAGDPLLAVREFESATKLDPSEENYFDWGTELLYHRAVWQAKQVFEEGVKAHPASERLLTSLGAALFAGALYDAAEDKLCAASDLNPSDPEPYVFMGKIEVASPHPLECVGMHLARFARLHPESPLAAYFYAMAIWKQHGGAMDGDALQQVMILLTKAVTLDPKFSDAYLQLGNLYSLQGDYSEAITFYEKAIAANDKSSEAHYRLGVAYDRTGDRMKAKQEFTLHEDIEKQEAVEVQKQRKEIKQFVVDLPKPSDASDQ